MESDDWRPLPDRVRRVWMINALIQSMAILAGCAVAAVVCRMMDWWQIWQPAIIAIAAAYAVLQLAFQPLQTKYAYAFNRFAIGDREFRIRKGWLFRSSVTVPFNRIQHVDTKQNPVLRRFGLTAVTVHTAVDEHTIDALDDAEAERVVKLITQRVAQSKEDL
ncbi:PH domain-containing protein [Bifidobacterium vespertilionis]|uniref:PH domain-containing protein n=1 Tax=Bifidobacterium vespertilionis TaxID=2562524 RepID=UPI001BDC044F|nr:PH domain-containing protein [Bifidobacterium vespertilionis]MBT1179114.1 PH domain-containing protein [Bifidobacterium vespertilionis]